MWSSPSSWIAQQKLKAKNQYKTLQAQRYKTTYILLNAEIQHIIEKIFNVLVSNTPKVKKKRKPNRLSRHRNPGGHWPAPAHLFTAAVILALALHIWKWRLWRTAQLEYTQQNLLFLQMANLTDCSMHAYELLFTEGIAPPILPLTQIGMPCQYHNFKLSQYHNVNGQCAISNTQGNAPSYSPLLLPGRPVPTFLLLANIGTASHTTYRYSIFIPDQRFHWSYLIPKIPMFLTIPLLTKDLIVFSHFIVKL